MTRLPTAIPEVAIAPIQQRRDEQWGYTPTTRLSSWSEAPALIDRAGFATLFPASPEVASLYAAFVGPGVPTDSGHSTLSGEVYSWRWELGRREVAFYGTLVRGKPTWVAWDLLPAVLRLQGDLQPVGEQHAAGALSADALRLADALADNGGTLTTGDLRRLAGFETGRDRRAAYLKAVAELDRRLLVGRSFGPADEPDDHDMRQTLIATRYPDAVAAASEMDDDAALRQLLTRYLSAAVFVRPGLLARHLGLDRAEVERCLTALKRDGLVQKGRFAGEKDEVFVRVAYDGADESTPGRTRR